jgi:hypothetical protein
MADQPTQPTTVLAAEVARLEKLYDQTDARIDRQGGVDYRGELARVRAELEEARRQLKLAQKRFAQVRRATETDGRAATEALVELLLDEDEEDPIEDIAADFIENEVGHYDWMVNWPVWKAKGDPLPRVQAYLDTYGIQADARAVIAEIERLVVENPGRWK